jgi:hypothetical protein
MFLTLVSNRLILPLVIVSYTAMTHSLTLLSNLTPMVTELKLLVREYSSSSPSLCHSHLPLFHITGIIGGQNFGLISSATLIDVRVANENGNARIHDILAGLDYTIGRFLSQVDSKGRLFAVASMSLSGSQSKALKYALYSFSKGQSPSHPLLSISS